VNGRNTFRPTRRHGAIHRHFMRPPIVALRAAGHAADANDFIVYNRATGALFYDANGSSAGGAVQLATLISRPVLTAHDFVVMRLQSRWAASGGVAHPQHRRVLGSSGEAQRRPPPSG
jgi:hypothetical protein